MTTAPIHPPVAEAHVAIGVMPTFFAENPRQWFQTAEVQFATARPTLNNGQKYFLLLQKLPAEIMSNCSDIITTCTIAAASYNGDPYTAMKSAILDYTKKAQMVLLHGPAQPTARDIKPSLLMAKLTNTLPHGTPTNTDLLYSFFMFRMPQYLREVLASQPCERSAWPRQRGRTADRGRSQSHRRGRAQTPHTQEFPDSGICWYHNKFQNRSNRCKNPCNWNGPDARAGNGASSR
jgi:hypothetical protein